MKTSFFNARIVQPAVDPYHSAEEAIKFLTLILLAAALAASTTAAPKHPGKDRVHLKNLKPNTKYSFVVDSGQGERDR